MKKIMTKDEAFDMLVEAVERNQTGQFMKVEDAMNVAAQALNYIIDHIDTPEKEHGD